LDYLKTVRSKVDGRKVIYIFIDNARHHHARIVKDYCKIKRIRLIFNSAYSAKFMPIEYLWNLSKRIVRREMIAQELVSIPESKIRQIIDLSLN
jgi:transposase